MRRPRIILADDHVSLVLAYEKLLGQDFEIVGTASDGSALLASAVQLQPDAIVVDLGLPLFADMSAGRKLKKLIPRTQILVITRKEDAQVASNALSEWASGVLLKRTARKELMSALRQLSDGKQYVTAALAKPGGNAASGGSTAPSHKNLTDRQREVLQLLAEGRTMRDTADILKLTTRTIAYHKYTIMKDFGLRNNVDLLKLAIREHLASAE